MDEKEINEEEFNKMINDPERLAGQLGETKDYIMNVTASELAITICQVQLGNKYNEKRN